MFVTTNMKLGFIHIPKCGGTSVFDAFADGEEKRENKQRRDMPWSPWPIHKAHTKYRTAYPHKSRGKLGNVFPEPEQWFSTVRNPYSRYHTWYYYQQTWDRKRHSGELELKGTSQEQLEERLRYWDKSTPLGLLKDLRMLEAQDTHWKGILRNIRECQWTWIVGSNARAFKLESIDKMWDWLEDIGTHAKPIHSKRNKDKQGTWQDLDEEVLAELQKMYENDFRKLKYDMVIT